MRQKHILLGLNLDGLGLEIGGGYNPLTQGPNVRHLDQADQETLRQKFAVEGADPAKVPYIDYVWNGTSYPELVGEDRFDWIVASHVIEHMPCLVTFLQQCFTILKPGGILSLAVPDKRYCFDHYRPSSGLARVIDTHLNGTNRPSPGALAEMILNASAVNGNICWNAGSIGAAELLHNSQDALAALQASAAGEYRDTHVWAFTPNGFRLLIHDLHALGLSALREVRFTPSVEGEFYIQLGTEHCPVLERVELARAALAD
ncbi:methyltransferase domain-containing protein [Sphingobium amiense]|uniref:Methyltransferase domain-containing protein n=1 Tax=Sphingobium amiense TaxID=135719 RepID=A0A494VY99_9SPHN|nr:methyltransferase domain-containing protein [Sphingobium amiense]BBD97384.1 methyltransferase domain-containing protein [Sphingobium amiense]